MDQRPRHSVHQLRPPRRVAASAAHDLQQPITQPVTRVHVELPELESAQGLVKLPDLAVHHLAEVDRFVGEQGIRRKPPLFRWATCNDLDQRAHRHPVRPFLRQEACGGRLAQQLVQRGTQRPEIRAGSDDRIPDRPVHER